MNYIRLIFVSFLFICSKSFSQIEEYKTFQGSNWYWQMDIGLAYPLHFNNEYSKEMTYFFTTNNYLRIGNYIDSKKNISIGGLIGGYSYGHNSENHEKVISELIDRNGPLEFGDIFMNDFSEWDFGLFFSYSADINEKLLFTSSLGGGIIYGPRRQWIYSYDNDEKFVYNVNTKGNSGSFVTGETGVNYLFYPEYRAYIGMAYEMTYGKLPVKYEVRYGEGDDLSIYQSYQYENKFEVWRHRIKFRLRFDFSLFFR